MNLTEFQNWTKVQSSKWDGMHYWEVSRWLKQNIDSIHYCADRSPIFLNSGYVTMPNYSFRNSDDAILFTLKFGHLTVGR